MKVVFGKQYVEFEAWIARILEKDLHTRYMKVAQVRNCYKCDHFT